MKRQMDLVDMFLKVLALPRQNPFKGTRHACILLCGYMADTDLLKILVHLVQFRPLQSKKHIITCSIRVEVMKPKAYSPTRGCRIIATSLNACVFWSAQDLPKKQLKQNHEQKASSLHPICKNMLPRTLSSFTVLLMLSSAKFIQWCIGSLKNPSSLVLLKVAPMAGHYFSTCSSKILYNRQL
jgi:hypothetical protein